MKRKVRDWWGYAVILAIWIGYTVAATPAIPEKLSKKVYQEANSRARKEVKAIKY
jgi:hypothetical protein